jgi:hypothetical protein
MSKKEKSQYLIPLPRFLPASLEHDDEKQVFEAADHELFSVVYYNGSHFITTVLGLTSPQQCLHFDDMRKPNCEIYEDKRNNFACPAPIALKQRKLRNESVEVELDPLKERYYWHIAVYRRRRHADATKPKGE